MYMKRFDGVKFITHNNSKRLFEISSPSRRNQMYLACVMYQMVGFNICMLIDIKFYKD